MTPFEVNLHTVPHLKALSSGIEAFRSHGSGRPFIDTTTILKVHVLYHTEVNSRFVLLLIVCTNLAQFRRIMIKTKFYDHVLCIKVFN